MPNINAVRIWNVVCSTDNSISVESRIGSSTPNKGSETGLRLNHRKPSPLKSTHRPLIPPPVALQQAGWQRLYGLWLCLGLAVVLTIPHSECDGNAEEMALKQIILTLLTLFGLVAIGDGKWNGYVWPLWLLSSCMFCLFDERENGLAGIACRSSWRYLSRICKPQTHYSYYYLLNNSAGETRHVYFCNPCFWFA